MEAVYGEYKVIARIHNDYASKFGIPRQSGIVNEAESVIIFEKPYCSDDAVRGLDAYNYVWLLWIFSENMGAGYKTTVRPPRLGGNTRVGVYATRSPFRPNPIGLSSVNISRIEYDDNRGPLIYVKGADLMNGTPIIDIKPYIPYTDIHTDAAGGFADKVKDYSLRIGEGLGLLKNMPEDKACVLRKILEQDPRPAYHTDPDRLYNFEYGGYHIEFKVDNDILHIITVDKEN